MNHLISQNTQKTKRALSPPVKQVPPPPEHPKLVKKQWNALVGHLPQKIKISNARVNKSKGKIIIIKNITTISQLFNYTTPQQKPAINFKFKFKSLRLSYIKTNPTRGPASVPRVSIDPSMYAPLKSNKSNLIKLIKVTKIQLAHISPLQSNLSLTQDKWQAKKKQQVTTTYISPNHRKTRHSYNETGKRQNADTPKGANKKHHGTSNTTPTNANPPRTPNTPRTNTPSERDKNTPVNPPSPGNLDEDITPSTISPTPTTSTTQPITNNSPPASTQNTTRPPPPPRIINDEEEEEVDQHINPDTFQQGGSTQEPTLNQQDQGGNPAQPDVLVIKDMEGREFDIDEFWDEQQDDEELEETYTLVIKDVPKGTELPELYTHYGHLKPNALASRINDKSRNAYLVFVNKINFEKAKAIRPPFGDLVPFESYDPKKILEDFFRVFLAYESKKNPVITRAHLRTAFKSAFDCYPESININAGTKCTTAYVEKAEQWIKINNAAGNILDILYSADQIIEHGASPAVLWSNCVDWKEYVLSQINPTGSEQFELIPPPEDASELTDGQKTNIADFNLNMGPDFFDWSKKQSHLALQFERTPGEHTEVSFVYNSQAAARPWRELPGCKFHELEPDLKDNLPRAAIEVHRKVEDPLWPVVEVANYNWNARFNRFKKLHEQRHTTPVTKISIKKAFSATNKKPFTKIFFTEYGSLPILRVEKFIQRFCPKTLFVGFHSDRNTNSSNGYGFLFLDDFHTAKSLVKVTLPLGTGRGHITFDWARKRKNRRGGDDGIEDGGEGNSNGYGEQRNRGSSRGTYYAT